MDSDGKWRVSQLIATVSTHSKSCYLSVAKQKMAAAVAVRMPASALHLFSA